MLPATEGARKRSREQENGMQENAGRPRQVMCGVASDQSWEAKRVQVLERELAGAQATIHAQAAELQAMRARVATLEMHFRCTYGDQDL